MAQSARIWIFYPPLSKMSGGMIVLLQLASQLQSLGRLGGVLVWEKTVLTGLPVYQRGEAALGQGDILLVPEGWPNAVSLGLRADCRVVIYCQNWAYLFHGLPPEVRWRELPVEFLAVSDPVAWYMEQVLGKKPAIIRPAIDINVFYPPSAPLEQPVRIGFMPRKNKALAEQIRRIFRERNPRLPVKWESIDKLDRQGVAEKLRSCHVFLLTGFPEGCPLPPLEALASGCLCAGFTGFGGLDYMRQFVPEGWKHHSYPLRPVPWGGNGWWAVDFDALGAARGLEKAVFTCLEKTPVAVDNKTLLAHYSSASQKREIISWLNGLASCQ